MRTKTTSVIAYLEKPQTSIFTQETPEVQNRIFEDELQEHRIEPEEVQNMLINLNPTKSSGPDKLHSRILKELTKVIDKP